LTVWVSWLEMVYFEDMSNALLRSRWGPCREIPVFPRTGSMYGTGRLPEIAESNTMETLSVQNLQDGYDELLANIRRLTVMVLDNLEAGSRDRTLDQGQKRLFSSTGARLLRLWRAALRGGGSQRVAEDLGRIEGLMSAPGGIKAGG